MVINHLRSIQNIQMKNFSTLHFQESLTNMNWMPFSIPIPPMQNENSPDFSFMAAISCMRDPMGADSNRTGKSDPWSNKKVRVL